VGWAGLVWNKQAIWVGFDEMGKRTFYYREGKQALVQAGYVPWRTWFGAWWLAFFRLNFFPT
jgi:hypothetical protein